MESKVKYFELELYNNIIKKIVHNETRHELFVFDMENKNEMLNLDLDFDGSFGIYIISKRGMLDEIYIGQTTKGVKRFNDRHNFLETKDNTKDYRVFFFDLNSERANKSVLDYIEMSLISTITYSNNKKRQTNSKINKKDEKYAIFIYENILEFLKVYDFNISLYEDEDIVSENIKTDLGDSILIKRKKKDILHCALEYMNIKNDWAIFKEITDHVANKFKRDLDNQRWKDRYGLDQALSRDLREVCKGYEKEGVTPLIEKKQGKDRVYRIIKTQQ